MSNTDVLYGHLSTRQRNEIFHAINGPFLRWKRYELSNDEYLKELRRVQRRLCRKFGVQQEVIRRSFGRTYRRRLAEARDVCHSRSSTARQLINELVAEFRPQKEDG